MSKKFAYFGRICVTYVLVLALVFSFVMSSFVGLNINVSATEPNTGSPVSTPWDGTKPDSLDDAAMEGNGSAGSPYLITNAAQLWAAVNNTDATKYFKVANPIIINDVSANKWYESVTTNWDNIAIFAGTFDGNNMPITGLYCAAAKANIGLFAELAENAKISNVILDNAYLSQTDSALNSNVGGIAGKVNAANVTIYGCTVRNSKLTNSKTKWTSCVGGIVGYSTDKKNIIIQNCAVVDTELVGGVGRAGIVGMHWSGGIAVTNCFVTGYSIGHEFNNSLTASNTYVVGNVTRPFCNPDNASGKSGTFGETSGVYKIDDLATIKGTAALTTMNLSADEWITEDGKYPVPKTAAELPRDFEEQDKDSANVSFEGVGTKAEPYLIKTPAQLYKAVNNTDATKYFKVANPITINNVSTSSNWYGVVTTNWDPDAIFAGTFDGNNMPITGLYCAAAKANIGLFAELAENAKIYNVILDNAYLSQTDSALSSNVGGIAGKVNAADVTIYGCTVRNSKLTNSKTKWTSCVGGIVGYSTDKKNIIIQNCAVVDTELVGGVGRAGIVGMHWSGGIAVTNCFVTGYSIGHEFNKGLTASNTYVVGNVTRPFCNPDNASGKSGTFGETSGVYKIDDLATIKGTAALTTMNLSADEWITEDGKYPVPQLFSVLYANDFSEEDTKSENVEFADGTGEIDDPYQITNAAQLYKAVNNTDPNNYYKVMNDIYVNNVSNFENWNNNSTYVDWAPTATFRGTFDGGNYTIYGLFATVPISQNWSGLGLFAKLGSDATVFNVVVDRAYIVQENASSIFSYVGGIAGAITNADNVNIYGCAVKNSTIINKSTAASRECGVGGLVGIVYAGGSSYDVTIKNSYAVDITLSTDTHYCAGVVGAYWTVNLVIENCFTTGRTTDYVFGHKNGYATIKNGYVTDSVEKPFDEIPTEAHLTPGEFGDTTGVNQRTKAQMKGENAIDNLHLSSDEWTATADSYPIPKPYVLEKDAWVQGPNVSLGELDGDGTQDSPYLITNGDELWCAVNNTTRIGTDNKIPYFRLENDIKLNQIANIKNWGTEAPTNSWLPSATFVGHFDGNFKTISGLYAVPSTQTSAGLFAAVASGSTIKNLTLDKSYIKATDGTNLTVVGGIVGMVDNKSDVSLQGLCVKKTTLEGRGATGGIVGLIANSNDRPVIVLRCSSVDNTISDKTVAAAGLVGNLASNGADTVVVSHSFTTSNYICRRADNAIFNNVYTTDDVSQPFADDATVFDPPETDGGVKAIPLADMKGDSAIDKMDLEAPYWNTVADSYPVVKPYSGENDFKAEDKNLTLDTLNGSGTLDDPYQITNAAELWVAVNNTDPANCFKVMNDIVINDTKEFSSWNDSLSYENWNPTEKFSGYFDGQGHTISGLYVVSSANKYLGLFGQIGNEVRIIDVVIENAYVNYTGSAGMTFAAGLIGAAINVSDVAVYGCVVKDSNISNSCSAEAGVGGLVGVVYSGTSAYDMTIKNCYAVDNTLSSGTRYCAGLVGAYWTTKLTMTDCFTTGDYAFGHKKGFATTNNCYVAGNVDTPFDEAPKGEFGDSTGVYKIENIADMKGDSALSNMHFDTSNWETTDGYPKSKIKFADNDGVVGQVWSGANARSFAGGDGTQGNPWKVDTPERLYRMLNNYSGQEKWFEITADIKLNDTTASNWYNSDSVNPWLVGKNFAGHVNGNGHTITGLYVDNSDGGKAALFPQVSGRATITNINIDKCYLVGNPKESYAGMLVGFVNNGALVRIAGCNVTNAVAADSFCFGGIVGGLCSFVRNAESYGCVVTIDYCTFQGKIDNSATEIKRFGGIIGSAWGSALVNNCISKGMAAYGGGWATLSAVYSDVNQSQSESRNADVNVISSEDMIGSAAKSSMSKLNWNHMTTVKNNIPTAKTLFEYETDAYQGTPDKPWSGFAAKDYAGGTGTSEDPYKISTPEQLYKFSLETLVRTNTEPEYYEITHDIYLNDISDKNWKENENLNNWLSSGPIASYLPYFYGHLDGNYHVIYGMYSDHNTQTNACAIIPRAKEGSTISELGFSEGYMSNTTQKDTYSAACIGFIKYEGKDRIPDGEYTPIKFTKCFVDDTFEVYSYYAGGFVGGAPVGVDFVDCYSNVYIGVGASISGALIGDAFQSTYPDSFTNCYAFPASKWTSFSDVSEFKNAETGTGGMIEGSVTNCYYFGSTVKYFDILFYKNMYGDAAKTYMVGFDFDNVWMTVDGGSPVLRGFANAEKHSSSRDVYTTISFMSGTDDISLPDMTGIALTQVTLPVPEREGYFFDGWYVYEEGACEYNYGVFPVVETTLYAKWTANSVTQNFENYVNTKYDYDDEDYIYYRPGVAGYSSLKVHGGGKAMLYKGEPSENQDLIINATDPIAVGEEYKIRFWVASDSADAKATVSLVHYTWPDIQDPNLGVEKMADVESLEAGKWTVYTYKFKASTPWLGIRISGNAQLFLDDIFITPVAEFMKDASKVNDYEYFYNLGETNKNTTSQTLSGVFETPVKTLAPSSAVTTDDTNNTIAFLVTVILAASALVVLSRVYLEDTKQEIENDIEE